MKKLILTFAALIALVSCGSDNEPPTPPVPPDKPVVVPEAKKLTQRGPGGIPPCME